MDAYFDIGQTSPSEWISILGSELERRPGYRVKSETDRLSVDRSYVSDNRLAGAVILGIFTAGLGLLLLTRRDTESFTVQPQSAAVADGTMIKMSGEWSPDTEALVARQATARAHEVTDYLGSVTPMAPGVDSRPFDDGETHPEARDDLESSEALPVVAPVSEVDDATRRGPARHDIAATFRVKLDDGSEWEIAAVNVVGRSPSVDPGEAHDVRLIAISDPDQSVSKNHARISVQDGIVRVRDLNSTNGTAIRLRENDRVAVQGEIDIEVPVGAIIELGDRSLTLLGD